jgi:hypothetical protein
VALVGKLVIPGTGPVPGRNTMSAARDCYGKPEAIVIGCTAGKSRIVASSASKLIYFLPPPSHSNTNPRTLLITPDDIYGAPRKLAVVAQLPWDLGAHCSAICARVDQLTRSIDWMSALLMLSCSHPLCFYRTAEIGHACFFGIFVSM